MVAIRGGEVVVQFWLSPGDEVVVELRLNDVNNNNVMPGVLGSLL